MNVNAGTMLNAFGEDARALALFEKARPIYERSAATRPGLLGGLYNNMALTCVALGRYDEARKLYDDTAEFYFNEQGLRPSKKMMQQLDRLGDGILHQHAVLDEIQADLTEKGENTPGGYLCSYPIFAGISRMVERMMERGGQSVYLMLCTVIDGKGNPMREGPMLDEMSRRMGDAVRSSIRRGDAMCQYG